MRPAVMKLDVKFDNRDIGPVYAVLALPDGQAIISHYKDNKHHVVRLDHTGRASCQLYETDTGIAGLLLQDDQVVILHKDGTLTWIRIKDGKKMDQNKVKVTYLQHGIALDNDTLLLVDRLGGRVFTFSKSSRKTTDMVNNLNQPTSVDRTLVNNEVVYVVCDVGAHTVSIYSDDWTLQRSVTGDGQVGFNFNPRSAVVLPDNTILVSDYNNDCISEWSLDGKFLGYLIQKGDINNPLNMSFHHPYVWIRYRDYPHYNVRCYQIYK